MINENSTSKELEFEISTLKLKNDFLEIIKHLEDKILLLYELLNISK